MGFNTTVFILNDGLSDIQSNPDDFVAKIHRHMHDGSTFGVGSHANCATVMRSEHADYFRLYGTWRNTILELDPYSKKTQETYENFPDVVRDFIQQARDNLDRLEAKLLLENG